MSLAEHLPPQAPRACLVDKLSPEHAAEFAVLINGGRSIAAIVIALRGAGYSDGFGHESVRKHRLGQCDACNERAAFKAVSA